MLIYNGDMNDEFVNIGVNVTEYITGGLFFLPHIQATFICRLCVY